MKRLKVWAGQMHVGQLVMSVAGCWLAASVLAFGAPLVSEDVRSRELNAASAREEKLWTEYQAEKAKSLDREAAQKDTLAQPETLEQQIARVRAQMPKTAASGPPQGETLEQRIARVTAQMPKPVAPQADMGRREGETIEQMVDRVTAQLPEAKKKAQPSAVISYDDLIPKKKAQPSTDVSFDDLIPAEHSSLGRRWLNESIRVGELLVVWILVAFACTAILMSLALPWWWFGARRPPV